jgi:cytoskeletal protein RodZ
MEFDPFLWKIVIMFFAIVGVGIVTAWAGLQAQKLPWWPIRIDTDSVVSMNSPSASSSTATRTEPTPEPTPRTSTMGAEPAMEQSAATPESSDTGEEHHG